MGAGDLNPCNSGLLAIHFTPWLMVQWYAAVMHSQQGCT
jgi:hypothetical protein